MESKNQNSVVTSTAHPRVNSFLKITIRILFAVGVVGQVLFAYYIAFSLGGTALRGDYESWTKRMINGFLEGDYMGNAFLLLHILLAFFITLSGPLQLIPAIRKRFPRFHRINGRFYIYIAVIISLGALYLVWGRDSINGLYGQLAISGNAILIVWFAFLTIRTAMARQFDSHRRWAVRTFVVVSGVWFFRIGFGLWIILNSGAPGSNETLSGPFDKFLALASYLLPLLIVELYFLAKASSKSFWKIAMSILLIALSVLLALAIFTATQIFWLPHL